MSAVDHRPDLRRIGERAFTEVLDVLFSLPVTVRDSSPHPAPSGALDPVTSTIPLTGPGLSGNVQLQLPLAFVAHAVRLLTGLDGAGREAGAVLDDAAGELANMVAGRVAAQLAMEGFPCKLGTPTVSRNAPSPSLTQPGAEHARAEFTCDGHALSLEVDCRYTNP